MEPLVTDDTPGATTGGPGGSPGPRERLVRLESAVNFRDIGGYRADGGLVRWGMVYRADNVSRLTPSDLDLLRDLAIASVLDLRTTGEVDDGRFPTHEIPVNFHHLPLLDAVPDPDRFKMVPGMLGSQYVEMAQNASPQIGRALRVLAASGSLPAVVHCAAGKDRTGVLVAVLLGLLGVDEETIAADYAVSAEAMDRLRRSLVERYPEGKEAIESADELFSAEPSNIVRLLEWIDEHHGSVEAYAASTGAGDDVVVSLRERLIEPA